MPVLCFFLILFGVLCLILRGIGMTYEHAHLGWLGLGLIAAGWMLLPVGYAIVSPAIDP